MATQDKRSGGGVSAHANPVTRHLSESWNLKLQSLHAPPGYPSFRWDDDEGCAHLRQLNLSPFSALSFTSFDTAKPCFSSPATIFFSPSVSAQNIGPPR